MRMVILRVLTIQVRLEVPRRPPPSDSDTSTGKLRLDDHQVVEKQVFKRLLFMGLDSWSVLGFVYVSKEILCGPR